MGKLPVAVGRIFSTLLQVCQVQALLMSRTKRDLLHAVYKITMKVP